MAFCLVTTFYPPYHFGGDAIFVHRLARALAARGHSVDVVHSVDAYRLSRPEPQPGFEETPGVRRLPLVSRSAHVAALLSHQFGGPGPYRRELREILAPGRYDVIHFHNISLVGGPAVLGYGAGIKLYTTHEYWLVCPTHVLFRLMARRASKIVPAVHAAHNCPANCGVRPAHPGLPRALDGCCCKAGCDRGTREGIDAPID